MDIGTKLTIICLDNDSYTGKLIGVYIGLDKDNLKRTCIIIEEPESEENLYGQVLIWCDDIKDIIPYREVETNG